MTGMKLYAPLGSPLSNQSPTSQMSGSSSGKSTRPNDDRMTLPSQAFKSPSGTRPDNARIPSRHGVGARMVHLSPPRSPRGLDNAKDSSGLSKNDYAPTSPPSSNETHHTAQHAGRNDEITTPIPSTITAEEADKGLDEVRSKPFATPPPSKPQYAQQTFIKRKPVTSAIPKSFAIQTVSQNSRIPDFATMQLAPGVMNLEYTFASNFDLHMSFGHFNAERSGPTSSSSTVESESWNAEDQFEQTPSEEYVTKRKVCEAGPKNSPTVSASPKNPAKMSHDEVRRRSPLDQFVQAGPAHGTAVRDFAFVPAKVPVSDVSWDKSRPAPSPYSDSGSSGNSGSKASDLIDLGVGTEKKGMQEATGKKREDQSEAEIKTNGTYVLPATVYNPPKEEQVSKPAGTSVPIFDGGASPPRSPYIPSFNTTICVVGGDAGSVTKDAKSAGGASPVAAERHTTADDSIVLLLPRNDIGNGNASTQTPSLTPLNRPKMRKKYHEPPAEQQRQAPKSLLRRMSTHFPSLMGTRSATDPVHCTDDDGQLNRDFEFPQRSASTPALADGGDQTAKRSDSLRVRLLRKLKLGSVKGR